MDELARLQAIAETTEQGSAVDEAIAAWQAVIADAPRDPEPRRALARLLRREGRFQELANALRLELDRACESADASYAALMDMADLHLHHLGRTFVGLDAAKRALKARPDSVEAFELLRAVYEEDQNWSELARLLDHRIEHAPDDSVLELLERLAAIALMRPQGAREAAKVYERMLELSPGHPAATKALGELYKELSAWDKLVVLKKEHVLPYCPLEEQLWAAVELAEFAQDKVKQPELLLELWMTVRDLDPQHGRALEALDDIHHRRQDWSSLAEVLATRIALAVDLGDKCKLLQRLAALHQGKLAAEPGAEQRALEALREVLTLDPANHRARQALRTIYLERHDFVALDELYAQDDARAYALALEQMLRGAQPSQRPELLRRLGRIYRDDLGQPRKAIASFEALCELVADDSDALQSLLALYETAGHHQKLADTLARLAVTTPDAEGKALLLQQLAVLHEEQLASPSEALRCWLEAATLQPEDDFLIDEAERLAQAAGQWQGLADTLSEIAGRTTPEHRFALLQRIARVQEVHLTDFDAAATSYAAVLEVDATHQAAEDGLVRMLIACERFDALFEHYARKLERGEALDTPAERLPMFHEIAALLDKTAKPRQAFEMLGRALRELPGEPETLDRLETLALHHGLWEPLLELYREVTARPLPLGPQVELRLRLGRLHEEHMSNPSRALSSYRRVLDLDPNNPLAQRAVARLERAPQHRLAEDSL